MKSITDQIKEYSNRRLLISLFALPLSILFTACSGRGDSGQTDSPESRVPLEFLPALHGDYFKLNSEIVGRPYHIYVRFPEGYDPEADKRYPVVYLLDGDSMFPILAANHLFLHYDDKLPEAIVIGIAYGSFKPGENMRSHDFSTSALDGSQTRGGAEDFLGFLEQELLPIVESKYLADSERRILFGQSRGGYMVLYTAFERPDLFWGRIASNPTLNPDREQFFTTPAAGSRNDLTLVVTSGVNDRAELRSDALEWQETWAKRDDSPWTIAFSSVPGGTHAANSTDSYRFGMHKIFGVEKAIVDNGSYDDD